MPRLDESRVLECESLHYPWDDWQEWALAQGLDARLARQARSLIREAFSHSWDAWIRNLCGWNDDGRALFQIARRTPQKALGQWDILMRTDGFRGDLRPGSTVEWIWGYLRPDAKRLRSRLCRGV